MSVRDDTPPIAAAQHARSVPVAAPRALGPALLRCSGAAVGLGTRSHAGSGAESGSSSRSGFGSRSRSNDIVAEIDLEVRAGETVAIVGRSGCGKTTLLHLLAGLLPPTAGSIEAEPAALMPQRDGLMPWASARDNAALPLRVAGIPRREARRLADGQLAALGLADACGRRVADLSGGMRQRVALARTLLTGRKLLLLDEPLAAVDALTRTELHDLLLSHLASAGRGAVLVTHDLDEAVRLAHRVLILRPDRAELPGNAASPSVLRDGPTLRGSVGDHMELRGGEPLRAALLDELGS